MCYSLLSRNMSNAGDYVFNFVLLTSINTSYAVHLMFENIFKVQSNFLRIVLRDIFQPFLFLRRTP